MRLRFKIVLFVVLNFCSLVVFAANDPERKAQNVIYGDKYFAVEDYYLAAEYYKKEIEKHPTNAYATYQIAESYRLFFDYIDAELWYQKAEEIGGTKYPLATYYHALMLKTNGKYKTAAEKFENFIASYEAHGPNDIIPKQATLHYNGCLLALESLKQPIRDFAFKNEGASLNSEYSDFAPAILNNDSAIVIASGRITSVHDPIYGKLGGGYLKNYMFEKGDSAKWKYILPDSVKNNFYIVNSKFNEGAGVFTKNKSKYYFTRCDEPIDEGDDVTGYNCAIYVTKTGKDGKWQTPIKLNKNINVTGEWNAQPTISPTGDTLIFVSKRPGGFGMHDLYMSVLELKGSEDSWGPAKNLGSKINTPYVEISPSYYSEENTLFFASSGHEGFGGLDLYMATGKSWDIVRNLGLPFNSNRDDLSLVLGDSIGYMASNRDGGYGNDDIYSFAIISREMLIAVISKDLVPSTGTITIRGRVLDEKNKPSPGIVVHLTDHEGNILKTTETDLQGVFVFANLQPGIDYRVVIGEKPSSLTKSVGHKLDNVEVFAQKEINTTSLEVAAAGKVASRVLFENIYFDFNKSDLRPESIKVLEELAAFCKKSPKIKIELGAHTDAIGTAEYNIALAELRGNAAYNYLVSKGIPKSSIIVNAIGESAPIASNANAVGRQLNRRVEFHVVGGGSYEPKAMVYVVEPATSMDDIAKRFGMTVSELKELNNLKNDNLQAFTPIRVRASDDHDIIAPMTLTYTDKNQKTKMSPSVNKTTHAEDKFVVLSNSGYNAGVKYMKYDSSGYYTVLPKNTLYSISKVCGVSVDEIIRLNNLKDKSVVTGQTLRIKESVPLISSNANDGHGLADAGISVASQYGQVVSIAGEKRYVVKDGDTIYSIAKRFGMKDEELISINSLSSPTIKQGMVLKIKQ